MAPSILDLKLNGQDKSVERAYVVFPSVGQLLRSSRTKKEG